MPEGQVLEFAGVTKRFGAVTAVSGLTARVEPGRVTGFLGPNGAGKTTTLRILLGLVRATSGTATFGGVPYAKLTHPLQTVGAVLEASSFHPGRTAANHLRVYAQAAGISNDRVDDVLALVGLADAAGRKVGGFSLGMRQRLGLAYALLGDPGVLVLDEPANGLDPEGIRWLRGFLRELAREGRTVLVSSHMLAEVQQTVDALVVISHGRLVFQGGLEDLADPREYATVVDSPERAALADALSEKDVAYEILRSGITVRGLDPTQVGGIAAAAGIALSTLQRRGPALEEVFLELVNGQRVHASATGPAAASPADVEPVAAPTSAEEDAERDTEASIAAELAAQMNGAPGAAAASGAAVAAWSPPAEPADTATPASPAAGPGFAVASTGVIDIVPPGGADAAGASGDPDVSGQRPFDIYDKTESDLEADAFFGSFDASAADGASAPDEQVAPEKGKKR